MKFRFGFSCFWGFFISVWKKKGDFSAIVDSNDEYNAACSRLGKIHVTYLSFQMDESRSLFLRENSYDMGSNSRD